MLKSRPKGVKSYSTGQMCNQFSSYFVCVCVSVEALFRIWRGKCVCVIETEEDLLLHLWIYFFPYSEKVKSSSHLPILIDFKTYMFYSFKTVINISFFPSHVPPLSIREEDENFILLKMLDWTWDPLSYPLRYLHFLSVNHKSTVCQPLATLWWWSDIKIIIFFR